MLGGGRLTFRCGNLGAGADVVLEDLFGALAGSELRLRIIEALIQHGPMKQKDLGTHLDALPGSMSKAMKELFDAGLLTRDRPRGECTLAYPASTSRFIQAGADLASEIARDRASAASARAARLRGQPLKVVGGTTTTSSH